MREMIAQVLMVALALGPSPRPEPMKAKAIDCAKASGAAAPIAAPDPSVFLMTPPPGSQNYTPPPAIPYSNPHVQADVARGLAVQGAASSADCASPSPDPVGSGLTGLAAAIYAAMLAYIGHNTAIPGTQCGNGTGADHLGNCACAAAVSQILKNAGYSGPTSYDVDALRTYLLQNGGHVVSYANAQPGDVIFAVGHHVGICSSRQCSSVESNSSSKATFSWPSSSTFDGSYGNAQFIIVHMGP